MLLVGASCAADDAGAQIEVPSGATFCSVYGGEYRIALDAAVPITDDRFAERADGIVAWARVLLDLAPEEIRDQALSNLRYHEAQRDRGSAADPIEGSNAMHAWAQTNC